MEHNIKSIENLRTYVNGTMDVTMKKLSRRCNLEKEFDALVNNNCSWSYKSQKIISKKCNLKKKKAIGTSASQIQTTVTTVHISKSENCNNESKESKPSFSLSEMSSTEDENCWHTNNINTEKINGQPKTKLQKVKNINAYKKNRKASVNTKMKTKTLKYQKKETSENPRKYPSLRNRVAKNYKEIDTCSDSSSSEEIFQTRLSVGHLKQIGTDRSYDNQSIATSISEPKCNASEDFSIINRKLNRHSPENSIETCEESTNLKETLINEASPSSLVLENAEKSDKFRHLENLISSTEHHTMLSMNKASNEDLSFEVINSHDEVDNNVDEAFSVNGIETDVQDLRMNKNSELRKKDGQTYNKEDLQSEIVQRFSNLRSEIQLTCEELEKSFPDDKINKKFDILAVCQEKSNENSSEDKIIKDFLNGEFMINKFKFKDYQNAIMSIPSKTENKTPCSELGVREEYEGLSEVQSFTYEGNYQQSDITDHHVKSNLNDLERKCVENKDHEKYYTFEKNQKCTQRDIRHSDNSYEIDEKNVHNAFKKSVKRRFETNFGIESANHENNEEGTEPQMKIMDNRQRHKTVEKREPLSNYFQHVTELTENKTNSQLFESDHADENSEDFYSEKNTYNYKYSNMFDKIKPSKKSKEDKTDKSLCKNSGNANAMSKKPKNKNKRENLKIYNTQIQEETNVNISHSIESQEEDYIAGGMLSTAEKDLKLLQKNSTRNKKNLKKVKNKRKGLDFDQLQKKQTLSDSETVSHNSFLIEETSMPVLFDRENKTDGTIKITRKNKHTKPKVKTGILTDRATSNKMELSIYEKDNELKFSKQDSNSLSDDDLIKFCPQNRSNILDAKFNTKKQVKELTCSDYNSEVSNIISNYNTEHKPQSFSSDSDFYEDVIMNEQKFQDKPNRNSKKNFRAKKAERNVNAYTAKLNTELQNDDAEWLFKNSDEDCLLSKEYNKKFKEFDYEEKYKLPHKYCQESTNVSDTEKQNILYGRKKRYTLKPKTWNDLEDELLHTEEINKNATILNGTSKSNHKIIASVGTYTEMHKNPFGCFNTNDSYSEKHHSKQSNLVMGNKFDNKDFQESFTKEISKPLQNHTNVSVLEKTIAAMEKCTSAFLTKDKAVFQKNAELKGFTDFDDLTVSPASNVGDLIEEFDSTLEYFSKENNKSNYDQIKEQKRKSTTKPKSGIEIKLTKRKTTFGEVNSKNEHSEKMEYLESTHSMTYKKNLFSSSNTMKQNYIPKTKANTADSGNISQVKNHYFKKLKGEGTFSSKACNSKIISSGESTIDVKRADESPRCKISSFTNYKYRSIQSQSPSSKKKVDSSSILNFHPDCSNEKKYKLRNKKGENSGNEINNTIMKHIKVPKVNKKQINHIENKLNTEDTFNKFHMKKESGVKPYTKKKTRRRNTKQKINAAVKSEERDETCDFGTEKKICRLQKVKAKPEEIQTCDKTKSENLKQYYSNESLILKLNNQETEILEMPVLSETGEIKASSLKSTTSSKSCNFIIQVEENGSFTLARYSSPHSTESDDYLECSLEKNIQDERSNNEFKETQEYKGTKEKYRKYVEKLLENEKQLFEPTANSQNNSGVPEVEEEILKSRLQLQKKRDARIKRKLIAVNHEDLFSLSSNDSESSLVASPKKQKCNQLLMDLFDE